jgi:DNA-binding response OmpR family regulator
MDATAKPADGATVLVVDDNPDVREILSRNLQKAGYCTVTASGGQECLDMVRSRPIDVILLDVMMPGMDGLTCCEELKKIDGCAVIPIILVTAKDDVDTRAAGMRLGVSEFITKPVNMNELYNRVRSQLHARDIRRQLEDTSRRLATLTSDDAAK